MSSYAHAYLCINYGQTKGTEMGKQNVQAEEVHYELSQVKSIDPLHIWHLNLNNNSLYILSLVLMFLDKGFYT